MEKIDIYDLVKFYVKKWPILLAVLLISAGLGYGYDSFLKQPLYTSTSRILFIEKADKTVIGDKNITNSLVDVLSSGNILNNGMSKANIKPGAYGVEELRELITVKSAKESNLISIEVETPVSADSQKINRGIVQSLIEFSRQKYSQYGEVQVVDAANLPKTAANINAKKDILMFTGLGLFVSVLLLFVVYDSHKTSKKRIK